MKIYNRTKQMRRAVEEFELAIKELGNDDGFIEVGYGEYGLLLEHYGIKKSWPWQAWPKINGVTVIPQPIAK